MKTGFLFGIAAALLATIGFFVWQSVDPAVQSSKAILAADAATRDRLGDIGAMVLVGYTSASPSSDRSGYREYRWYVWGSRSSGRVDVLAPYDTPADALQFSIVQVK